MSDKMLLPTTEENKRVFLESEASVHEPNVFPCTCEKHSVWLNQARRTQAKGSDKYSGWIMGEKGIPRTSSLLLPGPILALPRAEVAMVMGATLRPPQKESITLS